MAGGRFKYVSPAHTESVSGCRISTPTLERMIFEKKIRSHMFSGAIEIASLKAYSEAMTPDEFAKFRARELIDCAQEDRLLPYKLPLLNMRMRAVDEYDKVKQYIHSLKEEKTRWSENK